ncbi:helix-turn-helix domain-containing protein [Kordia jejudonensis]|uniref:helix-turn-helix domain-containing protein n=1 Tax=Kordia jejudonensis TaxID=1348245 RepID=UPI0009E57DD9|nr:helix-turn-helix domain-containing protein [Kordia jejudonensis]
MKKVLLFFYLLFNVILCQAQEKDVLYDEYVTLKNILVASDSIDVETSELRIRDYLKKVFKSGRKELIGRAYYLLSFKHTAIDKNLKYIDSSIFYTKDLKGDELFPMKAYFHKGVYLRQNHDYTGALDEYIFAESLAKANGSIAYQYHIKFNIASMKRRLGFYDESIALFKECLVYEKAKQQNTLRYQHILFQLSSIYYESNQTEKCTETNLKGIELTLKSKNPKNIYNKFVVNEGINLYKRGLYKASIDSIEKGAPGLRSDLHELIAHFYLAKSYDGIGEKEKALFYFKKMDSFFVRENDLFPPLRSSYEYLIQNAKREKNKEQQLYYTTQLLKVDSLIHADYKYLSNKIVKQYDFPELIESRDILINDLKNDKKQILVIGIVCLVVLIMFVILYYRRLKIKYQKRYDAIIKSSNVIVEDKTIVVKNAELRPVIKDIDEDIVDEILLQLNLFEKEKHYLINQISLKDVAKIVKTNSKYLSKIINSYKEKNFATYINDLRIDYLIDRIQHDPMYQKYTIKAIAEEGGFSNSEGFFRAFQKKTGLKPSYFIKKVKESQQKIP